MSEHEMSRLEVELELLYAMYPEQVSYVPKARELKFTNDGALLQLRLPESYPEFGLPDIIAASDSSKNDLRSVAKKAIKELGLMEGDEALDAIVAAFQQILDTHEATMPHAQPDASTKSDASKTVIIWLHHLLALTKRKLALSPTTLSGVTKPGYPGIMLFSGPLPVVTEHVNTLKAENWQAFQVRFEEEELWEFAHGNGIKEVETMAEVVKAVELSDVHQDEIGKGLRQKQEFLKAIGIK